MERFKVWRADEAPGDPLLSWAVQPASDARHAARFGVQRLRWAGIFQDADLPLDFFVADERGDLQRFRCESVAPLALRALRTCKSCGCTDDRACPGGCAWVSEALCSSCAEAMHEFG